MTQPLFNELAERIDRKTDCYRAVTAQYDQYLDACASGDFKRADQIRVILGESFEALLDATAAIFRKLG